MEQGNPETSIPVVGYACARGRGDAAKHELERQAAVIARECDRRSLQLIDVARDLEPANRKKLTRPGLAYALEQIAKRQASGLVVAELTHVARSAADLGQLILWLRQSDARFIAAAHDFDTAEANSRLAADLLLEVSRWELSRLSERTRHRLEVARRRGRSAGRPAVGDYPYLRDRIVHMRSQGMTLQAIAARLNEEGVPTVRGGAEWRHSSIQAALGYRRRGAGMPPLPPAHSAAPADVT
jgi:DNA invertase Pin-like site-specific DNA recombinase